MKQALLLFALLSTIHAQTPTSSQTAAAAKEPERTQTQPARDIYPRWSVIGEWHATHPDWTDIVTLRADGTLVTTRQGTTGRWILTGDGGTPLLVIRWDRFGTESLAMVTLDHFRGQPRGGRHTDWRRETASTTQPAPDAKH